MPAVNWGPSFAGTSVKVWPSKNLIFWQVSHKSDRHLNSLTWEHSGVQMKKLEIRLSVLWKQGIRIPAETNQQICSGWNFILASSSCAQLLLQSLQWATWHSHWGLRQNSHWLHGALAYTQWVQLFLLRSDAYHCFSWIISYHASMWKCSSWLSKTLRPGLHHKLTSV